MARTDRTYTISELAREFRVTPRALRFYEDKGLLAPRREGLNRIYGVRDRARLQLILRGKRLGFPLTEIKDMLDLYDAEDGSRLQMQATLLKFKERLSAMRDQRNDLDDAIASLQDGIAHLEKALAAPAPAGASETARAYDKMAQRRLEGAS